jgi:hypothetical protein
MDALSTPELIINGKVKGELQRPRQLLRNSDFWIAT